MATAWLLATEINKLANPQHKNNTIIIPNIGTQALISRNEIGLDDRQAGALASIGPMADQADCDKVHEEVDIPVCRAISKKRSPTAAAKCFSSASERYAACITGKPLPPLNIWN